MENSSQNMKLESQELGLQMDMEISQHTRGITNKNKKLLTPHCIDYPIREILNCPKVRVRKYSKKRIHGLEKNMPKC